MIPRKLWLLRHWNATTFEDSANFVYPTGMFGSYQAWP